MEELYVKIKTELKARPKKLTSLEQWLFVVVNTAKSIIDNTAKDCLDMVEKLADCDNTSQIQYEFDQIQGKFGGKAFLKDTVPIIFTFVRWLPISPIKCFQARSRN